jgi:hypothetical protein
MSHPPPSNLEQELSLIFQGLQNRQTLSQTPQASGALYGEQSGTNHFFGSVPPSGYQGPSMAPTNQHTQHAPHMPLHPTGMHYPSMGPPVYQMTPTQTMIPQAMDQNTVMSKFFPNFTQFLISYVVQAGHYGNGNRPPYNNHVSCILLCLLYSLLVFRCSLTGPSIKRKRC